VSDSPSCTYCGTEMRALRPYAEGGRLVCVPCAFDERYPKRGQYAVKAMSNLGAAVGTARCFASTAGTGSTPSGSTTASRYALRGVAEPPRSHARSGFDAHVPGPVTTPEDT
jgi:hypothetical protein